MMDQPEAVALAERFDRIALDFVNTVVSTRTGPVDALGDADSVARWMSRAEAPGWAELGPNDLPGRRTLLAEARRARVAIDGLFADAARGHTPDERVVSSLGRVLSWARANHTLERGPSGELILSRSFEALGPGAALVPIVEDAIRLAREVDPARLRRCKADDCLRWFVDTSKGGRRAWCSMATCGNRAKATRYRARHTT